MGIVAWRPATASTSPALPALTGTPAEEEVPYGDIHAVTTFSSPVEPPPTPPAAATAMPSATSFPLCMRVITREWYSSVGMRARSADDSWRRVRAKGQPLVLA